MKPAVRSDNGSGYISKKFRLVLKENGLEHHKFNRIARSATVCSNVPIGHRERA